MEGFGSTKLKRASVNLTADLQSIPKENVLQTNEKRLY